MSRLIPHIGPTLGYRVEWNGRSVAYLSDHQQPRDGSFALSDGARELVEGVDLLIHDSQFTPAEFAQKADWGHCTIEYAIWVAEQSGVGTLALFHHDPGRTDDHLDDVARLASAQAADSGLKVIAAAEGQVVVLPVD
jgi:ribonuclease BN (tRNA processing enzyme)